MQNTVYRKFAQTISFLPHFISTVSVVAMMVMLFSPSNGYVNWLLNSIGIEPIYFMAEPGWFRPLYVGSSIWVGIGWGAIVYLAAMFGIPASLYESAAIDGATRWQNIRSITLPSILPTIMILLILRVGSFINVGVEKIRAYPDKPMLAYKNPAGQPFGATFTAKMDITSDKFARWIEFSEWLLTYEGTLAITAGIEGETFNWMDGKPMYADSLKASGHPDAEHTLKDYGLGGYAGAFPEFLAMNVRNLPMLTAKEDFDHLPAVGFVYGGFTPQEIEDKVDLETIMQDTFKEHTLRFVIGQNDIHSDADWEAYIAALQKAGLAEYERVYQAAWDRAPFFWRPVVEQAGPGADHPVRPGLSQATTILTAPTERPSSTKSVCAPAARKPSPPNSDRFSSSSTHTTARHSPAPRATARCMAAAIRSCQAAAKYGCAKPSTWQASSESRTVASPTTRPSAVRAQNQSPAPPPRAAR